MSWSYRASICLFINKDISFSLPLLLNFIEPLKTKLLHRKMEGKSDIRNFIILIASVLTLFISGAVSLIINMKYIIPVLYGFLFYSFLFYYDSKIRKEVEDFQKRRIHLDDI